MRQIVLFPDDSGTGVMLAEDFDGSFLICSNETEYAYDLCREVFTGGEYELIALDELRIQARFLRNCKTRELDACSIAPLQRGGLGRPIHGPNDPRYGWVEERHDEYVRCTDWDLFFGEVDS